MAAAFRGELAASFARIEHCPIALTDAVRHRPGKLAVFAALPVRVRVGGRAKATSGSSRIPKILDSDDEWSRYAGARTTRRSAGDQGIHLSAG